MNIQRRAMLAFWLVAVCFCVPGEAQAAKPGAKRAVKKERTKKVLRLSPSRDAVVIKLEERGTFLVDWGARRSAYDGMKVFVFRRVEMLHPVTGKRIKDRFLLGRAKLLQVGEYLSIAKAEGQFAYPLKVGDFVVSPGGDKRRKRPVAGGASGPKTGRTIIKIKVKNDPDLEALEKTWRSLRGKTIETRIQRWLKFFHQHPKSRYRTQVLSTVQWLKALEKRLKDPEPHESLVFRHDAPRKVALHERVILSAAVVAPWEIKAVVCFFRYGESERFVHVPMQQHRKYYYQASLPHQAVSQNGTVEYFIEVIDADGKRVKGPGSARHPRSFRVFTPPSIQSRKVGRSHANLHTEYVDFFTTRFGKDNYFKLEIDYRFLMLLPVFYSIRMGFGIFEGQGEATARLDANPNLTPIPRAYTYGYLESEFRFHPYFAMMLRSTLGALRKQGPNEYGSLPLLLGVQVRARIGREDQTNLVLGFNGTLDIGTEGLIRLTIAVIERWPMAANVIVTNLPLGRDLGVRFLYQLGWRPAHWFSLDVLLGWNIRNINHSGPSFGLGATFRW